MSLLAGGSSLGSPKLLQESEMLIELFRLSQGNILSHFLLSVARLNFSSSPCRRDNSRLAVSAMETPAAALDAFNMALDMVCIALTSVGFTGS